MIPRFRAYSKEENEMYYPHNDKNVDWTIDDETGFIAPLVNLGGGMWGMIDKYELMQSTGLKDKNGVGIFEGDVVAVENHPFQRKEDSGVGMEIEGNYVVGWNQHDLTWCAGDLLLARLKPYVRVIGNIYENSELLEEQR
ncbi:YopX family protein [Enterococcus faecium]|uniref:YopX family protein n=1 Tax=Enterococcus faecium TaxID=1352 RepID=UPI002073E85E|nr:YopX family protein [Enterococcus faecium]MCM6854582.1 YopX family protein [Enterococcus faecium]MCM6865078.1 YopX family protein [Enterococcus faecium]MCM6882606.1 YopX family protein [Enterococcus faecium]MCM6898394.1 YopX family protein [Enterococcus faecium]MCM6904699.1 YopX family protein [Enterococcus faecium]